MSKSFPTPSKTFFILFFLHLFLSLVLRLTGQLEQRIFNEILIYGALAYSMIGSQWNYDPSYLKTSSVLFLLYLLSIYTLQDFSNNGLSASEAIEWGTTLFAFFSSWGLLSNSIKQPLLRVCCRAIYYGGLWLTASVPLLGIGYGIVSGGHALSADLILAVFQTNPGEALVLPEGTAIISLGTFLTWNLCHQYTRNQPFEENAESRTGSKAIHHFDSNGFTRSEYEVYPSPHKNLLPSKHNHFSPDLPESLRTV